MNIGLFGYGRMGKMVEEIAIQRRHTVSEKIETGMPFIGNADVYIDFTLPEAVLENVEKAISKKTPLVIGTTGWASFQDEVEKMGKDGGVAIIYGGNFSLGVNLFWRTLAKMTEEFSGFTEEYDVFSHEFHHRLKKDSPSGTALTTADIILKNFPAKKTICTDTLHERAIKPEELHVSSTRGGSIPGTHSAYFDSLFDTIELTHTARSREGFALGAVLAAEQIHRLPAGLHHFPEIFEMLFKK
ncbi:MAG: 4-hydroxy-tetrahydrodipicolinate reductase [Candidatus Peregrinibacteria bacterium]